MIKTIEWDNDKIIGNLKLDLTKSDGSPYSTIVLAGENGTGKTRILQTLSTFLNLDTIEPFKEIIYAINGESYSIVPNDTNPQLGFHKRVKASSGEEKTIITGKITNRDQLNSDLEDIRHYGCAYSKARSGFNTNPVKSSTTQQLDANKYDDDSSDDFTSIKQLIVDIKSQDNSDWDKIGSRGQRTTYRQFHLTSKIYRFEKAFNDFFDDLTFDGVDETAGDEKRVSFSKNGKSIKIDDLSTGEKQIVFRGAQLLKNSKSINNGVVLIDEPELSMHPKWQAKIFDYYRGLFTTNGIQTAQIFFATHSENVIRAAVKDPNVLVIILADVNGTITANKINERVLPSVTAAEINYLAFGVISIDYHIALYGDFQMQTGKSRIEAADSHLTAQTEYNATIHEKRDSFGNSNYQTLPTYIRNAIDHPDFGRVYSDRDLETSILLLRSICQRLRRGTT